MDASDLRAERNAERSDSIGTAEMNRRIAAAAQFSAASTASGGDHAYRIGANDEVQVLVFGAEAFSGTHRVGEGGEISIPLLGPVAAGGRTARELEEDLEARLGATYMRDPHVSVQVLEMRSHGVSVVGAVRAPGVYQVSGPSTLLEVLAMAEGLSEDAGSTVLVLRPNDPAASRAPAASPVPVVDSPGDAPPVEDPAVFEVDLGALLESGDPSRNVAVYAGDIVQVRPAGLVYVVGAVNQPGGFMIPPGRPMTVLQALAMAENLSNRALASGSVIVREHEDGAREEIPVNLDEVLDGDEVPPILDPGDVLFVPTNEAKAFTLGAVDALVRMVTLRGLF